MRGAARATSLRSLVGLLALASLGSAHRGEHLVSNGDFEIRRWTQRDGLPQTSVTALARDGDGYLWAGTFAGLARFDGAHFAIFNVGNTEGLSTDRVIGLHASSNGDLWIVLQDRDVCRRRNGRFESWPDDRSAPRESIASIAETADGSIWFGGRDLTRFRDGRFDEVLAELPERARIESMCARGDELWMGTTQGAYLFAGGRLERIPTPPQRERDVHWVSFSAGGSLWAATSRGLLSFEDHGFEAAAPFEIPSRVQAVATWGTGLTWLGLQSGLYPLYEFDRAPRTPALGGSARLALGERIDLGVDKANVRAILCDGDDATWVGLVSGGLLRLTPREFRRWPVAGATHSVRGLALDRGGVLWAHTDSWRPCVDGRELDLPAGSSPELLEEAETLLPTRAGSLWLTLESACLELSNAHLRRWEHDFPGPAVCLFEDRAGCVWFSGYRGAAYVEGGELHALRLDDAPTSAGLLRILGESSDGELWFGSEQTVMCTRGGARERLYSCDGVPRGEVRAMVEFANGELWFSSYGSGLFRLGAQGVDLVTTAQGLPDEQLGGMLLDGDALWINSNSGVFRVRCSELSACADARISSVACRVIDTGEGNGSGACRLPDGRLCFATVDGVVEIDPNTAWRVLDPPRARIEAIIADDVRVEPRASIELAPIEQRLEIDYAGVQLDDCDGVRFRYRLEGYDDRWVDAGAERRAVYTRLPPGRYSFRVSARNRDGEWREDHAALELAIAPRWHERASVRVLGVLCLLLAASAAVRWRMRHVTRRALELTAELGVRARIERELRESQEKYRVVAESATDAIVTFDAEARVVYANPAAARIFGGTPTQLRGEDLRRRMPELFDGRDVAAFALACAPAGAPAVDGDGAQQRGREIFVERADGTRVPVEVSIGVQGTQEGGLQVTGIVRDISERRAAEGERARLMEQLTALNSNLELRIRERTRELEEALGDLEAFTYSVSHDLRAPVRHIASFAGIVAEDYGELLPQEARERLAVVQNSASRLGTLIDDLLALSGVGRCALRPVWVEHDALVDAIWEEMRAAGRTGNAQLERAPLPRSRGDEGLLRQVWVNLIDNAVKYSAKAGRPRIDVDTFWENGRCWYRVRDNGVGFDAEQKGLLFGVFTRLHADHEFPGTGVGLAIVKRIVERHGGEIRADARLGGGAVFEFTVAAREIGRGVRRERVVEVGGENP